MTKLDIAKSLWSIHARLIAKDITYTSICQTVAELAIAVENEANEETFGSPDPLKDLSDAIVELRNDRDALAKRMAELEENIRPSLSCSQTIGHSICLGSIPPTRITAKMDAER